MLLFLKIALRNITRNKFRSSITIAAIAIGLASLIFIRAFVDGAHHQMIENYTGFISGQIQIHTQGFQENMGLNKSIPNPQDVISLIQMPQINAEALRVKEYVLASSAEHSLGVLLMGVDPQNEPKITELDKRVRSGKFLSNNKEIVIGHILAKSLNVGLQDKVVIMAQAFDGSLASEAYRVCGFLDTGVEELDKGLALITLQASQDLFVLGNRVSEIALRAASIEQADRIAAMIKQKVNHSGLEVLSWKEISPALMQWVEFDVAFINIILFIVLLVVAAGILNTLLMGILERTREFGIMISLGTTRLQIIQMVALESLILGFIGVCLGFVFGVACSLYFGAKGINLQAFSTALNNYYTGSIIYTRLSIGYLMQYGSVVLLTSIIVSIYPAWRAANLKPVEAIRHN